jgi:hypothetical protein
MVAVFPVERRAVGLAREAITGTAVLPTVGVPCEKFGPEDKPTGLIDKSWRASMAAEYGYTQGTTISDWDISGPVYADTLGHFLYNCLGDYTTVGVATTPNTTLTGASNVAGAVVLTVAAGTSFTIGMNIQVGTGSSAEIVTVSGAGSSTSIPIATTPLRFTHAAAEAVTNTTPGNGNYTHVFSTLNSPLNGAQPPTHTLTDMTGMSGSFGARQYASSCASEVVLTSNAQQFLTWDAKGQAFLSSVAASAPTFNPSTQPAQAAWNSVVGIGGPATGGTLVKYVAEWAVTIQRKLDPVWTTQGAQNPYVIARGGVSAGLKLMFDAAPSEAPLLALLNNTQPQTQFIATGPNSTSITVDAQVSAYDTSKLNDGKAVFGYDVSAKLIGNTTNAGNSPGYSPLKITIVNAVASY